MGSVAGNVVCWFLRYLLLNRGRKSPVPGGAEWDSWCLQGLGLLTIVFVRAAALGCAERSLGHHTGARRGQLDRGLEVGETGGTRHQGKRDSQDVAQEDVPVSLVTRCMSIPP